MKNVNSETARIALIIHTKDTNEEVLTRFARPEKLDYELFQIGLHDNWIIAGTYLADQYGNRI